MVIHVLYKIMDLVREAEGAEARILAAKSNAAGLTDGTFHLNDLMGELLRFGKSASSFFSGTGPAFARRNPGD